jgi:futalosine hydrolase
LKILYIAATQTESDILKSAEGIEKLPDTYRFRGHEIIPLVTGVGSMATAWTMMKWFSSNEYPDIALNAGIAGSFNVNIKTGDVVMPVSDCFADSGIEDRDHFRTLAEAGFAKADEFPFSSGKIICSNRFAEMAARTFRSVSAITVNTASGSEETIKKLANKFNPDIETLEGATFFYICARERIPFLAIRAISNRVEPRNKDKWDIPTALRNLSEKIEDLLITMDLQQ